MCVALPGRVVEVLRPEGPSRPGRVRFGDVERHVDLVMVPDATEGDWVVVHAGFAVSRVSADEARSTRALLFGPEPWGGAGPVVLRFEPYGGAGRSPRD